MNVPVARVVLDASALLALLRAEEGGHRVREAVQAGALISAVNWAEVLTRLVQEGGDPMEVSNQALPFADAGLLSLVPYDDEQAREMPHRLLQPTVELWHGRMLAESADAADRARGRGMIEAALQDFTSLHMVTHANLAEQCLRSG